MTESTGGMQRVRGRPRGPGVRRPLSHVRGRESVAGERGTAEFLGRVFRVHLDDVQLPIRGIHGIHPYPARLHPAWARALLREAAPEAVVYDPFCGSGTVLAEAMLSGRNAFGSDVNEVALRVARLRTGLPDGRVLERLAKAALRTHEQAASFRDTPFAPLAAGERRFPRHVLGQLLSLRDAIEAQGDADVREVLLLAMTPLLGKFQARPNRVSPDVSRRAVRDQFLRRAERIVDELAHFGQSVPDRVGPARLRRADARRTDWDDGGADLVITSPPYPGVYDYADEARLIARWIGDASWVESARAAEIGRRGARRAAWRDGMHEALLDIARIVRPGGAVFLVIGDGVEDGRAVWVDDAVRDVVSGSGLRYVAHASHVRPHFHDETAALFAHRHRREHLMMLTRAD